MKRFQSENFDVLRKHSKKDLRKHVKSFMTRRMICGTCNVVLLKRQGTELGESSEGPASDALDPELQFIKRKIQGEK